MTIPQRIREYLARSGGQFKARSAQGATLAEMARVAGIDPARVAQATVLEEGSARLVVVHPLSRRPDLETLNRLFKRQFAPCSDAGLKALFPDNDPRAVTPLASLYQLKVLLDKTLEEQEEIYFSPGVLGLFVRASRADFFRLLEGAWVRSVTLPLESTGVAEVANRREAAERKVRNLQQLPPMPAIAMQILQMRNNPYTNVSELAAVVEQDPSLTAQILRYASSPFYNYKGKVDSVAMAIARVLGMDFVMDLSFGLALGKPFRNPLGGPLGLNAFWRHATYAATLSQALCARIPYAKRPSPGISYLAGLMHNFGILLLGHLFPEQFARLNKALLAEPERPLVEMEGELLGLTHVELGLWLMEAWDMPREVVEAVREHHNPGFREDYAVYANIVYVANTLLKRHGIGDAATTELPGELLERLGISAESAEEALAVVMKNGEAIDFMAGRMAA